MTEINVFYQGEGVREIEHIELGPEHTFASLKAILIEKHGLATDILVFLEDSDEPASEVLLLRENAGHAVGGKGPRPSMPPRRSNCGGLFQQ